MRALKKSKIAFKNFNAFAPSQKKEYVKWIDEAKKKGASKIHLEVRDAGPGLPQGSEERIFERFYRADPARSGEGTGLGLSIARAIIEAHGGTIRATSGEGAVVTIELPAL